MTKITAVFLAQVIFCLAWGQGRVSLEWDPNSEDDLAGYKMYYGRATGNYSTIIDVGNKVEKTVTGLQLGKAYFFVVTAYNTAGLESPPSNEVETTITDPDDTEAISPPTGLEIE